MCVCVFACSYCSCPYDYNPNQEDSDKDGIGNAYVQVADSEFAEDTVDVLCSSVFATWTRREDSV
jgi:hypothetical protein